MLTLKMILKIVQDYYEEIKRTCIEIIDQYVIERDTCCSLINEIEVKMNFNF
jgi:hypothetical protein